MGTKWELPDRKLKSSRQSTIVLLVSAHQLVPWWGIFFLFTDRTATDITENISKVEKQIEKGEESLASLLVVQGPEVLTEDGDPIYEIREELDEDGNIICKHQPTYTFLELLLIHLASSAEPHGQGTAQKIDVNDLKQFQKYFDDATEETKKLSGLYQGTEKDGIASYESSHEAQQHESQAVIHSQHALESATGPQAQTPESISVHEIRLDDEPFKTLLPNQQPSEGEDPAVEKTVVEVEEDVVIPNFPPTGGHKSAAGGSSREEDFVLSVDEPQEAADLRRQMIDYNLHDIGAVVAELNLEEGDYDDDDDYDGDGDYEDEDEDENEDKYGRSTNRIITTELEREMQALQARIRERQEQESLNKKPQAKVDLPNAVQVTVTKDANGTPTTPKKKGVTFSEKLDVTIIPPQPKPQTQEPVLPPSPTLDPDDALPFLVNLLAREQMKEDMQNKGLATASGEVIQDDGWAVKMKDEAESKKKQPSIFKTSRMDNGTRTGHHTTDTTNTKLPALKSTIVERKPDLPADLAPSTSDTPRRPSRFKTSRSCNSQPLSILNQPVVGIYGNTSITQSQQDDSYDEKDTDKLSRPLVVHKIIERPPAVLASSDTSSNIPTAPSELDPAIHRQEVAMEYFKTRNKLIQKEGGFLPHEEEEMYAPLDDGGKKVSRFKAARLGMRQSTLQ